MGQSTLAEQYGQHAVLLYGRLLGADGATRDEAARAGAARQPVRRDVRHAPAGGPVARPRDRSGVRHASNHRVATTVCAVCGGAAGPRGSDGVDFRASADARQLSGRLP